MSAKLEKLKRRYRLNDTTESGAQLVSQSEPLPIVLNPENELGRLQSEFQLAKQRLNDFIVRSRQERRAQRLASRVM